MIDILLKFVTGIPEELVVLLFAMMPVIELRGALPLAIGLYQMPIPLAFFLVILGNMIPAFFIIYGWDAFICMLKNNWPWLHEKLAKLEEKTQGEWDHKIEKHGPWALILFVAIPLPGTGVWTGALAAWIFKLSKKRALWSLFAGVILASFIIGGLTIGGLKFF